MAFVLPAGLVATKAGSPANDNGVLAVEDSAQPSTRMLVALGFPSRWPGFGVSADTANLAVMKVTNLQPWPELDRVVFPDDSEAIWWVAYKSSPGWWLIIIGVLAAIILASITFRIVWVVLPEEAKGGLELFGNIVPLLILGLMVAFLPSLIEGFTPMKRLPREGA